jgi:hypothetical protein
MTIVFCQRVPRPTERTQVSSSTSRWFSRTWITVAIWFRTRKWTRLPLIKERAMGRVGWVLDGPNTKTSMQVWMDKRLLEPVKIQVMDIMRFIHLRSNNYVTNSNWMAAVTLPVTTIWCRRMDKISRILQRLMETVPDMATNMTRQCVSTTIGTPRPASSPNNQTQIKMVQFIIRVILNRQGVMDRRRLLQRWDIRDRRIIVALEVRRRCTARTTWTPATCQEAQTGRALLQSMFIRVMLKMGIIGLISLWRPAAAAPTTTITPKDNTRDPPRVTQIQEIPTNLKVILAIWCNDSLMVMEAMDRQDLIRTSRAHRKAVLIWHPPNIIWLIRHHL